MTHQTVLLQEAIEALNIDSNGIYVDTTFGRGGHSRAILAQLSEQGRLIVFDKDPEAIEAAYALQDPRITVIHDSFSELTRHLSALDLEGKINGILLDLGVSSPQLDQAERGFSFRYQGPLDMRMDNSQGMTAAEWLNSAEEKAIADVLWRYGEERFSRRIARKIVQAREESPLKTTNDLVQLIEQAIPKRDIHKHPATRSFQAIRIFINQELQALETLLPAAVAALAKGGRLAVISFHSLEDRIVKQFIQREAKGPDVPSYIPLKASEIQAKLKKVGKFILPNEAELQQNPRARSAKLRVAEKQ